MTTQLIQYLKSTFLYLSCPFSLRLMNLFPFESCSQKYSHKTDLIPNSDLILIFFFFLCTWIDDAHFDASQYLFFGKDILEEVELGGLEGQEHDETAPVPSDYEFHFSTGDKELVRCLY